MRAGYDARPASRQHAALLLRRLPRNGQWTRVIDERDAQRCGGLARGRPRGKGTPFRNDVRSLPSIHGKRDVRCKPQRKE